MSKLFTLILWAFIGISNAMLLPQNDPSSSSSQTGSLSGIQGLYIKYMGSGGRFSLLIPQNLASDTLFDTVSITKDTLIEIQVADTLTQFVHGHILLNPNSGQLFNGFTAISYYMDSQSKTYYPAKQLNYSFDGGCKLSKLNSYFDYSVKTNISLVNKHADFVISSRHDSLLVTFMQEKPPTGDYQYYFEQSGEGKTYLDQYQLAKRGCYTTNSSTPLLSFESSDSMKCAFYKNEGETDSLLINYISKEKSTFYSQDSVLITQNTPPNRSDLKFPVKFIALERDNQLYMNPAFPLKKGNSIFVNYGIIDKHCSFQPYQHIDTAVTYRLQIPIYIDTTSRAFAHHWIKIQGQIDTLDSSQYSVLYSTPPQITKSNDEIIVLLDSNLQRSQVISDPKNYNYSNTLYAPYLKPPIKVSVSGTTANDSVYYRVKNGLDVKEYSPKFPFEITLDSIDLGYNMPNGLMHPANGAFGRVFHMRGLATLTIMIQPKSSFLIPVVNSGKTTHFNKLTQIDGSWFWQGENGVQLIQYGYDGKVFQSRTLNQGEKIHLSPTKEPSLIRIQSKDEIYLRQVQ